MELVFDKPGQACPGFSLDLGQEGLEVFLYQLVQSGFFGTPPLVVYALSDRRGLNRLVHDPLYCYVLCLYTGYLFSSTYHNMLGYE